MVSLCYAGHLRARFFVRCPGLPYRSVSHTGAHSRLPCYFLSDEDMYLVAASLVVSIENDLASYSDSSCGSNGHARSMHYSHAFCSLLAWVRLCMYSRTRTKAEVDASTHTCSPFAHQNDEALLRREHLNTYHQMLTASAIKTLADAACVVTRVLLLQFPPM
jgi:hypothetical protein